MANDAKKVIRLDYKAYLADMDKLYDTTDEAAAKDAGIYNEKVKYEPMSYIVGSKKLFPALDKAIADAKVGEEFTVEVPCEEGAGVRNPKLIETHSVKDFYRQEINPYPGMPVSLGNKNGIVLSVGAGRVKVDFNSQLAGHDLMYRFTVVEEITDAKEKAKAIIEVAFGSSEGFDFEIADDKVTVIESAVCKFHQNWAVAKYKIVTELREIFGVDRVDFLEVWDAGKKE